MTSGADDAPLAGLPDDTRAEGGIRVDCGEGVVRFEGQVDSTGARCERGNRNRPDRVGLRAGYFDRAFKLRRVTSQFH